MMEHAIYTFYWEACSEKIIFATLEFFNVVFVQLSLATSDSLDTEIKKI